MGRRREIWKNVLTIQKFTTMAKVITMRSAKSVKAMYKKLWEKTPETIRCTKGSAIIVAMAASVLAAPMVDEIGKMAVQDMAHELNYTWDPFDGDLA
jgi:hypothetical protein